MHFKEKRKISLLMTFIKKKCFATYVPSLACFCFCFVSMYTRILIMTQIRLFQVNLSPNLSSVHVTHKRLMFQQVIFSLFSLVGIARQGTDYPAQRSVCECLFTIIISAHTEFVLTYTNVYIVTSDNSIHHWRLCLLSSRPE